VTVFATVVWKVRSEVSRLILAAVMKRELTAIPPLLSRYCCTEMESDGADDGLSTSVGEF
jgi:hypothetical protein